MTMTNACSCGCSAVTDLTKAEECSCGCECCAAEKPKSKEQEVVELMTLRSQIDKRLTELGA